MKKQNIYALLVASSFFIIQSCASFIPCTTTTVYLGGQNSSFLGKSSSWTNAFGVQGGLAFNVMDNFSRPVVLRAEVNVSQQGARWEDDWGEGLTEGITRLTYLNFPLVGRYQHEKGFYGEAGIQPGFLLSARDKFDDQNYSYRDWVSTFDLSIPLGAGYEFPNNFGVGIRLIPGLTNINSGEDASYLDRNFVVALRGTYTFLGKDK